MLCSQHLDSEDLEDFREAVAEDYYFQVRGGRGGEGVEGQWMGGWLLPLRLLPPAAIWLPGAG